MTGFQTLFYKELLRFWKVSVQTVAAPVLTSLLYLLVFAQTLEGRAVDEGGGWWRLPVSDVAHVEDALARLREAGVSLASLEVSEPELEEVFVKIMRREAAR